jgi:hypothetical protein
MSKRRERVHKNEERTKKKLGGQQRQNPPSAFGHPTYGSTLMSAHDPRLRHGIGQHPQTSDGEARKRVAVLRIAEQHFTAAEFSELMAAISDDRVDMRIYEDGVVLMREF